MVDCIKERGEDDEQENSCKDRLANRLRAGGPMATEKDKLSEYIPNSHT